ncbi:hypothetical protein DFQ28_011603 [Apophysomyces sp. BC1034]|nr:hypothetical protein DFQ30_010688 [Apophysomyces sp. BC1015]KAG0184205.1 hypothetical protein DFQ28_011603 [Apophysomyces sp. BC1034]
MSKQSLESAVNIATSQAKLAEALGVTQQTVSNWMRRGSVPPEHCSAIERLTGGAITRLGGTRTARSTGGGMKRLYARLALWLICVAARLSYRFGRFADDFATAELLEVFSVSARDAESMRVPRRARRLRQILQAAQRTSGPHFRSSVR